MSHLEQLSKIISTVVSDFDHYQTTSIVSDLELADKYSIESVYQVFLDHLVPPYQHHDVKDIYHLRSLLGIDFPDEVLDVIRGSRVTIYFADDTGYYSQANTLTKTLNRHDSFTFKITLEKEIRIDLSEFPSHYSQVRLVETKQGQILVPSYTNGIVTNDGVMFYEKDPILIFDTSQYPNGEFELTYVLDKLDFLAENMRALLIEERTKNLQLLTENQLLKTLKQEYDLLNLEYSSLIQSRRWKWTTAMINLFRRK